MCKEKKECGENCACINKARETFQKTKDVKEIKVTDHEQIKPKDYGKETFGV